MNYYSCKINDREPPTLSDESQAATKLYDSSAKSVLVMASPLLSDRSLITTHPGVNFTAAVERYDEAPSCFPGVITVTPGLCGRARPCRYQQALMDADRVQSESDTQQGL